MNPHQIYETYLKESDVAVFKHTDRNCLYKEAEILKELKYDYIELIDKQVNFYKSVGYPENNGLYEFTNIFYEKK